MFLIVSTPVQQECMGKNPVEKTRNAFEGFVAYRVVLLGKFGTVHKLGVEVRPNLSLPRAASYPGVPAGRIVAAGFPRVNDIGQPLRHAGFQEEEKPQGYIVHQGGVVRESVVFDAGEREGVHRWLRETGYVLSWAALDAPISICHVW